MVELTFFEIHLDGAEFTANAPSLDTGSEDETEEEEWEGLGSADESGGPNPVTAILGSLFFAIIVAVVVRRVFGGGGDDE